MSRKRQGTGDQLTGGTRDVNPQYMSGSITLSAANTTTEVTVGTPIVRVGSGVGNNGKSVIMEVLKVYFEFPAIDADAAAATNRNNSIAITTTTNGATPVMPTFDNPRIVAYAQKQLRNAFTAAGTGVLEQSIDPVEADVTDGAGHGILVATDNVFVVATTLGQAGASVFRWKILYRFKEVSLVEYIGIVQSQQ